MKLYRIKDWDKHYEVSDSKKVAGPLQWVPVRTKTDGFGYLRITQEKDRASLLAAWYLMLGIAAKQSREDRGKLSRNGVPLTPEDMELLTRFPAEIFERALVFFSDPRQGWIDSDEIGCRPDESGQTPGPSESSGPTGQDRTGHTNKTGACAAGAAPQSDSEWLAELRANKAYAGIDVDREYAKMLTWCQANRKQPNRRRFVNWLNKCDRPLDVGANWRPRQQIAEPQGWKAWLNHERPESRFSAGQDDEAHKWSDLDEVTQRVIVAEMRKENATT